jgi:membrane protease YdiL (CAAX protease family)
MKNSAKHETLSEDISVLPESDTAEQERRKEASRKLRFTSGRIGLSVAIVIAVWYALMLLVGLAVKLAGSGEMTSVLKNTVLLLNEITFAVSVAVATFLLRTVPKTDVPKEKVTAKGFFKMLSAFFASAIAGAILTAFLLLLWRLCTGNNVENTVSSTLSGLHPFIVIVCLAVLAPILEELFFRKLIIDRLYVFGESTAIMFSAIAFALFHQNPSQFLYTFMGGWFLAYFYCRTGNYWVTVLIHAFANLFSGAIPVIFQARTERFLNGLSVAMENTEATTLWEKLAPVWNEQGWFFCLYFAYVAAYVVLIVVGLISMYRMDDSKGKKGAYSLSHKESAKIIFKTPWVIVSALFMLLMTARHLFS